MAVDEIGEDVMSDEVYLSSMQRNRKEGGVGAEVWSCQAVVFDSAIFETVMHVSIWYVRTTKSIQKERKKKATPRRSGLGMGI